MNNKKPKDQFAYFLQKQISNKFKVVEYKVRPDGSHKKRTLHKDLPLNIAEQVLMFKEKKIRYNLEQLLANTGNF